MVVAWTRLTQSGERSSLRRRYFVSAESAIPGPYDRLRSDHPQGTSLQSLGQQSWAAS
jgi:hypothetical protein